jgi:cardiolipin synthase
MSAAEHDTARYAWRDLITVPSLLSLARVPLAVAFVCVVGRPAVALAVLALAGLTDVLDGWYARTFGQCTATGALVDGATDKLVVFTVAGTLLHARLLTLTEVMLLGARDAGELVTVAWIALKKDDHALHEEQRANALGKLTTFAQFAVVVAALLRARHFELSVATAVLGVAAAVSYARRAR